MRLFFTRRWLLFLVAVGVLAYGCWLLGQWQFGRLHDREDRNEIAASNMHADPVPLRTVLSTTDAVAKTQEWTRVTATGEYVVEDTIVVRYQTRDGRGGVDVVTPLRLDDGTGVLVNRGWIGVDRAEDAREQAPAPPAGQVTVVGWVRGDGDGSSTKPNNGSVRAISSLAIAETTNYPLVQGFLELDSETPPPAESLAPVELPGMGKGPHFFYGLQWWFFGALAVGGFIYLAIDEVRKSRRALNPPAGSPGRDEVSAAPPE